MKKNLSRVIDLTHTICENMPVYPGTEQPQIIKPCTIEANGFVEHQLTFFTHTGTHIDAPAHILPHGKTLDQMSVEMFIGSGAVIDLRVIQGREIQLSHLIPFQHLFESSQFILLHTGWSQYWGQEAYFSNYPVLTVEAAQWVQGFKLKGIGMDMISIDGTDTPSLPIHHILLESGIIIENLTQLEQLPQSGFTFCCFPLKLVAADGSPVRAVGIVA